MEQQDLFLEHPEFDAQGILPFQYKTLYEYQQYDPQLLTLTTTNPQQYRVENMGGHELVCCYHEQHNRICLTDHMLPMVMDWFHQVTSHNAGITHLQESLRFHFHHKSLLAEVR